MNHAKKLISGLLSVVMLLVMATTAFAQEATPSGASESDNASITISNASKGETYKVYKLFDATVTGNSDGGSIAYTGTVPTGLTGYFEADANGYISVKDTAYADPTDKTKKENMSDGLREALAEWTTSATPLATAESDGTALTFNKLPYGYYVVTTTQGASAITVTSTNPTANIVDKNSKVPGTNFTKKADSTNVNIGDTVTYTVSFDTSNYEGEGTNAKKILSYTITDTLPDFLKDVHVQKIVIKEGDGEDETHTFTDKQFDSEGKITLDWYDGTKKQHLYKNGSTVTIVYTAKVADTAAIAGAGNTNSVTLTWEKDDGKGGTETGGGDPTKNTDTETIYTYAIALKKVNETGKNLAGATFELPFYVKKSTEENTYVYAGTTQDAEKTYINEVTTPEDGLIVIKGVKATTYSITETKAPDGYNKLTAPFEVEAAQTNATTTNITKYVGADGTVTDKLTETNTVEVNVTNDIPASVKVVVNKTGTELPSTGGMGTTLFYALGGVLVTGAAILLVVKKRMERSSQ